jgi:hypothetical protein
MASKKVELIIRQPLEIGKVDLTFEVRTGNALMGTLTISKGSVDWRPTHARKAARKTWEEFSALMLG